MSIKIILADDHRIIHDSLTPLLDKQTDIEVVGVADNGRKAVKLTQELKPDLVIMDISMPDLNGMEATRQIIAQCPRVKIIALSMNTDKRYVKGMLKAGASGYLTKGCSFEELANAIRLVAAGKKYISPEISSIVIDEYLTSPSIRGYSSSSELTMREREVLQLLAEGKKVKEIADTLFVSMKTVHVHRKHIMEKLDINNIAGLIKYAIKEGLTTVES